MLTLTCDGCGRRIAESDDTAARRLPAGEGGALVDWCGECLAMIRTELPRLARAAAEARRAALAAGPVRLTVQQRARSMWGAGRAPVQQTVGVIRIPPPLSAPPAPPPPASGCTDGRHVSFDG